MFYNILVRCFIFLPFLFPNQVLEQDGSNGSIDAHIYCWSKKDHELFAFVDVPLINAFLVNIVAQVKFIARVTYYVYTYLFEI